MSRAFVLGAGASIEAQVPSLWDIHTAILRTLPPHSDETTTHLRALLSRFIASTVGMQGRPPIVDFISLMDLHIRDERPLDKTLTASLLRKIRIRFIAALADAVGQHKGQSLDIPRKAGLKGRIIIPRYIKEFAQKLRRGEWDRIANRMRFNDFVITTNYDTCVDLALYWAAYSESNLSEITDVFLGSTFRDPYDDADAFSEPSHPVAFFNYGVKSRLRFCKCLT